MKINIVVIGIILLSFLLSINTLHLDHLQNTELQSLKDQQSQIGDQVSNILNGLKSVREQVQSTSNSSQKVSILQQAINTQRQQLFQLRNKTIYPFNQSQTACEQLTDKQKITILDKLQISRKKLTELQQINSKLDQNLQQVQSINDNIQKQLVSLQQIQDIVKIQCKQNMSPTIFQSNLNSKNWILGPQTMNDLEQQYAERAITFPNVTNCPLDSPFFSPAQETCIVCQQPNPIFNMYSKECTRCEGDQQLDSDKKICKSKPHYTNFTKVQNWNLQNGTLPAIDPKLTPCSDEKPYFNGIICISCQLPKYWSVSANYCKKCPANNSFDLNTKKCQQIVKFELTILQNTKWVSSNLTKVVEQRAAILKANQTSGNYQYCPNTNSPYYDGTTCISCNYFDIDSKKCIEAPNKTQYDANMRRFLIPQSGKQTNINAKRYIASKGLVDSNTPNCNESYPYYDGIACIQCLKPFDIFNVDESKCTACNADQVFNQVKHTCDPRPRVYISSNLNKLLATPKVSVSAYKTSLINKINNSTDSIVYPCSDDNEYSNFTNCFPCQDNEYFNVQTLKCVICDGTYDEKNKTCKEKVYVFTNLKANNIIDMEDKTVQGQNSRIAEFLQTHKDSYICPIQKPYAIDDNTCGPCPKLFSYSNKKCTQCAQFYIYVAQDKKCQKAKMLVNFTNSQRILVSNTETLSSFKQYQQSNRSSFASLAQVCPGDRPYTQNRDDCFNCTQNTPYFNYTKKECQNCPESYIFDSASVSCVQQYYITLINSDSQPRMLGYDNYTMNDYRTEQDNIKRSRPYKLCTEGEPFGTGTGCKQCSEPTMYFDIKNKQCSDVNFLINFPKISPDYLLPAGKKIDSFVADEQAVKKSNKLTKLCPDDKPYTKDRSSCFVCNSGEYFNFESKQCEKCPEGKSYAKTKSCEELFYITRFTPTTELKMKGYRNYTIENYKQDQNKLKADNPYKQCQQSTPYGTVNGCLNCVQPTPYFNVKKKICSNASKLINFTALGKNYTIPDGKTLSSYQQDEEDYKNFSESITVECPKQTPFTSDRDYCFVCKQPDYLFNLATKQCESCKTGYKFDSDKKRCTQLFYITNINSDSQKKMVGSKDYTMDNFKSDQLKLKQQNQYQLCSTSDPYGTLNGCQKCLAPQQYFDIKNTICTTIKRTINFNVSSSKYITAQGKKVQDYKNNQSNYQQNSKQPILPCTADKPFTSDHLSCFACTDPQNLFNLEVRQCKKCGDGQQYDSSSSKCIQKQYYTLFSSTTQKNILTPSSYTLQQYKDDQNNIKQAVGSSQCTVSQPYATSSQCIACSSDTYFNIDTKACVSCGSGKKFFDDKHQCLNPIYLTDFSNKNIKKTSDYSIDDAKKAQLDLAGQNGNIGMNCTSQKPFATDIQCIACTDSSKPYFNIKSKQCQGCREFYQYFQSNLCKDNIILTNTKEMIGYIEVDNYTKYNVQKFNNFTYLQNDHVVDCPADNPFYDNTNCINCNQPLPVFNLMKKQCVSIDSMKLTNISAIQNYVEEGDYTLKTLQKQYDGLLAKKVNVQLCPTSTPYLAGSNCIACSDKNKYFNLATQLCQPCNSGEKCLSKH